MSKRNIMFGMAVLVLAYGVVAVAAPGVMRYQGRLTSSSGEAITAPTSVTFSFYSAESGGSPLASFSDTHSVTPNGDGIYTTEIGSLSSGSGIPAEVFASEPVYLNVNVGGEDLTPRMLVTSSAYALQAESAKQIGTQSFTTAESINAGDLVALDNDGLLRRVALPQVHSATMPGTITDYDDSTMGAAAIGNDQVVVAYTDYSNGTLATAVVATCVGNQATFGAPTVVQVSGDANSGVSVTSLGGGKVLFSYTNNSSVIRLRVATVSGGSFTFGDEVEVSGDWSPYGYYRAHLLGLNANKAVLMGRSSGAGQSTVWVVNIDDLTPSVGVPVNPNSYSNGSGTEMVAAVLDTDKVLLATTREVWVATINESENSVEVTDVVAVNFVGGSSVAATALETGSALVVYGGNPGRAVVYTQSGDAVTTGTPGDFDSCSNMVAVAGFGPNRVGIFYADCVGQSKFVVTTVTGSRVSFDNSLIVGYGWFNAVTAAALDAQRALVVHGYEPNSAALYSDVPNGAQEYVGVAEESVGSGAECRVTVGGGITQQFSGLIPGRTYYVGDGVLSLLPPSARETIAGKALSSNRLVVQY